MNPAAWLTDALNNMGAVNSASPPLYTFEHKGEWNTLRVKGSPRMVHTLNNVLPPELVVLWAVSREPPVMNERLSSEALCRNNQYRFSSELFDKARAATNNFEPEALLRYLGGDDETIKAYRIYRVTQRLTKKRGS